MKPIEAEKLLGGHATGTLTEAERATLFAAALEHQETFDALVDEEALRELLADPKAKAQLLAALAAPSAEKVIPFWRRTSLLGAAASLLVASLAGIAYLRSPDKVAPPLPQVAVKAPSAKAIAAQVPGQVPAQVPAQALPPLTRTRVPADKAKEAIAPLRDDAAPPPPPAEPVPQRPATTAGASVPVVADAPRERLAEARQVEARDNFARKAEAPRPVAALMAVVPAPMAKKAKASGVGGDVAALSPGSVSGGAVGGVAPAPARRAEGKATPGYAPTWTLEPRSDGSTRVLVKGPTGAHAVLLRRHASTVEVLTLRVLDPGGEMTEWAAEVRLVAGEVLDLYLLNVPVAEPARLPETGSVDGFRVRIYPSSKK